jgi:predicted HTH domain antitoxin
VATVTFELPDDQLRDLGTNTEEAAKNLRLAAAFHLCGRGRISTGRAARLAGLSYADFLTAAAAHKVDLYHYDIGEIEEEIKRPVPTGADLEAIKQSIARAQSPGS